MISNLNSDERSTLLKIARDAINCVVCREMLHNIELASLSTILRQEGASFVTLTRHGMLRGCIGTLEAYQPLAMDVQEHAIAAATQDYRFNPVQMSELNEIEIEISCLSRAEKLVYHEPAELVARLRPRIDGVVLSDGNRRATFLPQVWEQLPEPEGFLNHLCQKMGASSNLWRQTILDVSTYQVEEFKEARG